MSTSSHSLFRSYKHIYINKHNTIISHKITISCITTKRRKKRKIHVKAWQYALASKLPSPNSFVKKCNHCCSRCGKQEFETRQIITINYRYLSIHPVTDSTMEIWKKGTIIPVPKKGDEVETSEDSYICHQSYRNMDGKNNKEYSCPCKEKCIMTKKQAAEWKQSNKILKMSITN